MNPECRNYKQELDDHIEICPACGKETQKDAIKSGGLNRAVPAVSFISIAAIVATFLLMFTVRRINFAFVFVLGAVIVVCAVIALMSRAKNAIIITLVSAAAFAGIFIFLSTNIFG